MSVPSIKGVAFQFLLNIIEQRIGEGKLERAALEDKLTDEDLRILDTEIVPGLWYPIENYRHLLELTLEMEGRPREQWAQAGFEAAAAVLSTEAYKRLIEAASNRAERSGFVLVHLAPLFLNFSSWSYEQNPGDGSLYHVNVTEAEPLPNAFVSLIQGVIEYLSTQVSGGRLRISSERSERDHVIFRALPDQSV